MRAIARKAALASSEKHINPDPERIEGWSDTPKDGKGEIERILYEMMNRIDLLGAALTQLEERLDPILLPANMTDDPPKKNITHEEEPATNTRMGNSLYRMTSAVKTLCHHVNNIHERVAL